MVRQCQLDGTCTAEEAGRCSASDGDEEATTCGNSSSRSTARRAAEDEKLRPLDPAPVPVPLSAATRRKTLSPSPRLASRPTAVHRYTNCSLVAESRNGTIEKQNDELSEQFEITIFMGIFMFGIFFNI